MILSHVKRMFRWKIGLEVSETFLGHTRLCDLLADERLKDVCTVVPVPGPNQWEVRSPNYGGRAPEKAPEASPPSSDDFCVAPLATGLWRKAVEDMRFREECEETAKQVQEWYFQNMRRQAFLDMACFAEASMDSEQNLGQEDA